VEWSSERPSAGFLREVPGYEDPLEGRLATPETLPLAEMAELSDLLRLRPGAPQGATYPVGYLGKRRAEVELDRAKLEAHGRRHEPQLTYRLTPEPGVFHVEIAFSRLPFQIGASEQTRSVRILKVWDSMGQVELQASVSDGLPAQLQVESLDLDAPPQSGRYRLLCEFVDPAAWRQDGDRMLFERATSVESIRILPPEGWQLRRLPARKTAAGRVIAAELRPASP
jgi:hypothetical protein